MNSKVSFEELQAPVHYILSNLGISVEYKKAQHPFLIDGRTALIYCNGKKIGIIGK